MKISPEKQTLGFNDYLSVQWNNLKISQEKLTVSLNDYLYFIGNHFKIFQEKLIFGFKEDLCFKWKGLENISRKSDCLFERLLMP